MHREIMWHNMNEVEPEDGEFCLVVRRNTKEEVYPRIVGFRKRDKSFYDTDIALEDPDLFWSTSVVYWTSFANLFGKD